MNTVPETKPGASTKGPKLILASGSPRRRELIGRLGLDLDVAIDPADIDETPLSDDTAISLARRLAQSKAEAVAARHRSIDIVLGADTVVDVDGVPLGQPRDEAHATAMLRALSGRSHLVHTGVCGIRAEQTVAIVVSSSVHIRPLDEQEIAWYIATGEPFGKAGSYALQGIGDAFVERVEGSVSNVIGLPLSHTALVLRDLGLVFAGVGARPR